MGISTRADGFIPQAVEQYSNMIMRIAWQYLGSKADAEDVMQDVFVRLMGQTTFQDEGHLKAWLARVTVNRCKDIMKSSWRRKTTELTEDWPAVTPEQDEVLEEIMKLKPNDRNVLYLHYYEKYTIAEMAAIFDENPNTINSRLTRARQKLKTRLVEGRYQNA